MILHEYRCKTVIWQKQTMFWVGSMLKTAQAASASPKAWRVAAILAHKHSNRAKDWWILNKAFTMSNRTHWLMTWVISSNQMRQVTWLHTGSPTCQIVETSDYSMAPKLHLYFIRLLGSTHHCTFHQPTQYSMVVRLIARKNITKSGGV